MIGFELSINGIKKQAVLENGVTSIIINRIITKEKDEINLDFVGFDSETNESIKFHKRSLKLNDKITITVKDISSNSKPEKIKKIDPNQTILEGKLKAYKNLKEELTNEGLI
ncbi:hypothetical protein [Marivirga sp.]|uniref:hypothetical protein n=1 Tax=Marivirga sp. TaxID=2018662 RepID=UPI0025EEA67D|nr:hypothetical protein [Marivirga sp.]